MIVTLTMNPALDIATATDSVVPGHKLRCSPPRYDPGGGGVNVARAAHGLGGEAVAVFPCGGPAGALICRLLEAEGVAHDPIAIDGFTRESLAVEETRTGEQYRFILPGPEISPADRQRCLDRLAARAAAAAYIVASGSLPPGVPEDFYQEVGRLAQRCGARFVLDTSGPALRAAGKVDLLKPSLRELQDLAGIEIGSQRDQEEAARRIVAEGRAEILVLSLGSEGALLATAAGTERFAAIPVEARSTVGAGDSMLAGIVLALTRGFSLREAVRYGIAAGAAALLGSGTQLCRRADVDRLYRPLTSTRPVAGA
jgi:6-phosphofructokinase 2